MTCITLFVMNARLGARTFVPTLTTHPTVLPARYRVREQMTNSTTAKESMESAYMNVSVGETTRQTHVDFVRVVGGAIPIASKNPLSRNRVLGFVVVRRNAGLS
jgi:hypothetical protein